MNDKNLCVECGSGVVQERIATVEHRVGARAVVVENERHTYCPSCETISYRGSQLAESQHAIAEQIRREDGLLTPEELRVVRVKYGFTQAEMERMLTSAPKTWIRWERGKVVQSRAADQMIRQIARNPDVVRALMREAGIQNDGAERELALMDRAIEERVLTRVRDQISGVPDEVLERIVKMATAELQAVRSASSPTVDRCAA